MDDKINMNLNKLNKDKLLNIAKDLQNTLKENYTNYENTSSYANDSDVILKLNLMNRKIADLEISLKYAEEFLEETRKKTL